MAARKRILFISTMEDSWGGSEELWSQAALKLAAQGFGVTASGYNSSPLHHRVQALVRGGIDVQPRVYSFPLSQRLWRKVIGRHDEYLTAEVRRLIKTQSFVLAVTSAGGATSPVELLELLRQKKLPFVTIGQANTENWWPDDALADRYRNVLPAALKCYFVSKGNLSLFEKQIGCQLLNTEIARNPFNVSFNASPPWPVCGDGRIRFACVGRLHPISKGQDLLLEALATSDWSNRNWVLTLYGEGPMKDSLQRLADRLGLRERVVFAGHSSNIEDIWASNHVLVMPSRIEGLPLALVEASLCGRPAIATSIAGHPEVIEDGVSGFLAKAPSVPSVQEALEKFWACRSEAANIGEAAREK